MPNSDKRVSAEDLGLLAMRIMLAVVFAFHGSQKLFSWFGGHGIEGTAGLFEKIGIPLPTVSVIMAGGTELFAGLALGLGLMTRLSGAGLFFTMMVAAFSAHSGFSAQAGGMEYPLVLGVFAAGLALTGPGRFSLGALCCPAAKTS
jgi:putative oxidoreductase